MRRPLDLALVFEKWKLNVNYIIWIYYITCKLHLIVNYIIWINIFCIKKYIYQLNFFEKFSQIKAFPFIKLLASNFRAGRMKKSAKIMSFLFHIPKCMFSVINVVHSNSLLRLDTLVVFDINFANWKYIYFFTVIGKCHQRYSNHRYFFFFWTIEITECRYFEEISFNILNKISAF